LIARLIRFHTRCPSSFAAFEHLICQSGRLKLRIDAMAADQHGGGAPNVDFGDQALSIPCDKALDLTDDRAASKERDVIRPRAPEGRSHARHESG
jgi:hypothetical protein